MDTLNVDFVKNNLIDLVFALRYSYGTDVHMGGTKETSTEFEELMKMFMTLSKKESVLSEEINEFSSKKEILFSHIFHHSSTEDTLATIKFTLKHELAKLEFFEEFPKIQKEPVLVANVVEKFDDEE